MIKKLLICIKPWLRVVLFIACFTLFLVLAGIVSHMVPGKHNSLFFGLLGSVGGAIALWLFKTAECATWEQLGVRWTAGTLPKFLLGILIGLAAFSCIFIPLLIFTPLEITTGDMNFSVHALVSLLTVLLLALMEEIGFRSYPQLMLGSTYGVWMSQLVMALVFASYHILYGWQPQIAFSGPFVWAFLFGLTALWSKGIAVPTGIHFALNVLQDVSGINGNKPLSIWRLGYTQGASNADIALVDTLGISLHVMMLIFFLLLTLCYTKRIGQLPSSPEVI